MDFDRWIIFIAMMAYMVFVIIIGLVYSKRNQNADQFYLGGRSLGPWVTAMSAEASDMSGWLLMGLPGVAYLSGMGEAIWTAIGLAVGTYLNWKLISRRLRKYTEVSGNAITIPDFFNNRFKDKTKSLMTISALIILFFFTAYVATGFISCGKLFQSIFGFDYRLMMLISAAVIVIYTAIGGFLAESTTDFIQGILMCISLVVVLVVGVVSAGGIDNVMAHIKSIPGFFDVFKIFNGETASSFGAIPVISTLAWGLGYFGMPHVLLRFMAIRDEKELKKSRIIATVWVVLSLIAAVAIGLVGAALFPGLLSGANSQNETIFIEMSTRLLPPVLAGLMMSGIMAATMSTSDSQLLVTSSAISTNFYKGIIKKNASDKEVMWVSRATVVIVTIIAAVIALDPSSSIFRLVSYAWAGFGAAFGPVVILSLFWKRMTKNGALAGMIAGGLSVVLWGTDFSGIFSWFQPIKSWHPLLNVYELLPAFIIAAVVIVVVSLCGKKPSAEITDEFDAVVASLKQKA